MRLRILSVSPRVVHPPTRGALVRTYNLARGLAERHDVTVFSHAEAPYWPPRPHLSEVELAPSLREIRHAHPAARLVSRAGLAVWASPSVLTGAALRVTRPPRLRELLRWADVTLVEAPWQFDHCRRVSPGSKLVLAAHNVERERFAAYGRSLGWRWGRGRRVGVIARIEGRAAARADLVLAVSEEDAETLAACYGADPGRIVVVPNGADTIRYAPVDVATRVARRRELGLPACATVTYVGSRHPFNEEGLRWVRRLAADAPDLTFVVVGDVAPPGTEGNLVSAGAVPDLAPYLEAADLSVCPVEFGAGSKIKLFECASAGLPTVVFEEAIRGTGLRDGEHVVVVPKSPEELLAGVRLLLADDRLAARLRAAGRRHVVERHDWGLTAARLEEALVGLMASA